MGESLADHVGIAAHCHLKGGVGMAEAMERDVLVDVRCLYPVCQRFCRKCFLESGKYFACLTLSD